MTSTGLRSTSRVTIPERPTRRAKAAVSYREDEDCDEGEEQIERPDISDFDNEFPAADAQPESEDEYTAPATRRKRATPQREFRQFARRGVITIEDSDEGELAQDDEQVEKEGDYVAPTTRRKRKSPAKPLRKSRSKKRRRTTPAKSGRSDRREFSSDLSASDSNTESEDDTPLIQCAKQKKLAQRRTTRGRSKGGQVKQAASQALVRRRQSSLDPHSEDKIPEWCTLPYHVILNVMSFVGAPLIDERDFRATENFKWLFNASKMCRVWSEAALTILWQDPVLIPMERAHLLSKCLRGGFPFAPNPTYNYQQKVKHISLEVQQTATYTHPLYGHFSIEDLVFNCPRLVTLEIYHLKDQAPYRDLDENIKWFYPEELFGNLNSNVLGRPTELKSWRWSSRLVSSPPITNGYDFQVLNTVHLTPSFQSLKKLAFVNYQTPDIPRRKPAGYVEPQTEKNIADIIALLPNLKHLIFEACGIVNGILLPLLPRDLYHLEIIACGELIYEDLAAFLLTHGSQLRSLVLDHNQALSLSWTPILSEACPKLEILQCNLAYYNLRGTYRDNEPIFKELIGIDEIPTWPSTLRSVELTQLRKWEAKAAENFFNSLLNSASNLSNLRVLIIKAILDSIGWRDRGDFRDRWMKRFDHVFKRHSAPPLKYLRSMGSHVAWLEAQNTVLRASKPQEEEELLRIESGGDECRKKRYSSQPKPQPEGDVISDREVIELSSDDDYDQPIAQIKKEVKMHKVRKDDEVDRRSVWWGRSSQEVIEAKESQLRGRKKELFADSKEKSGARTNRVMSCPQSPDDDEPIAVRRRRRGRKDTLDINKTEVQLDGSSVTTTDSIHYRCGGSLDANASYHSERRTWQDQVVQGMCDIVELRIDNLRPTENQFTEADFLDSEPDEDGDWNGEGGDEDGWVW